MRTLNSIRIWITERISVSIRKGFDGEFKYIKSPDMIKVMSTQPSIAEISSNYGRIKATIFLNMGK